MRTLYFECTSGISGDMTVAALLDLGADPEVLREGLASLKVEGYHYKVGRVAKSGIDACDFDVILDEDAEEHHHHHGHHHGHHHHDGGHHEHRHRNLQDIMHIIEGSGISAAAKKMAGDIFHVVAQAEAKAHGLPVEQVHFHEVGAVDSIVDIVAAAVCVDNLGVDRIVCSPLSEGTGTIRCQHGVMPVPAPATLEIVRAHNIPLVITDNLGEMVTPTGAAIVAALADEFGRPGQMRIQKTGYGAGKREYKTANLLRAMLLDEDTVAGDTVLEITCNLDDMTGEQLGYACEKLLEAGALDVWCTPITMKKSRPGQMLSVLARPEQERLLVGLVLKHTSTIGVRVEPRRRHVMARDFRQVETPWGAVQVKDCRWGDVQKMSVEYESARLISDSCKIPLDQVYRAAYNGK